jgi:hypothetical protein
MAAKVYNVASFSFKDSASLRPNKELGPQMRPKGTTGRKTMKRILITEAEYKRLTELAQVIVRMLVHAETGRDPEERPRPKKKGKFTPQALARIAAGQRKRWAKYHAAQTPRK